MSLRAARFTQADLARIFAAAKRAGMAVAPAVASSTTCRIMVTARPRRLVAQLAPEDWEITGISRSGPCDNAI